MPQQKSLRVCFLAVLVFFTASVLSAQTTFATLTGTVTDASGAVIPNVTITARHQATGIETITHSNEAGIYTLAQLKEGEYTVTARGAGFKEFVGQKLALVARDYRRFDISLEVGAVETQVEVLAEASLIETETARISDTKGAELLKSIPLNTRGIWAFLSLSPNVLQAGAGSSAIRFAGSRGNQAHWAIDGTTMSDGVEETQIGPLANYIESFQEIKIDVSNNTAEFGTIGQVTMISKSGTNNLHGNVFDYYTTPWFRARDPFAPARATGISHTPGGSIGGPVYLPKIYNGKDKTFFFFSYETSRGSATQQLLNPTVPLEAWRNGDFSRLTTPVRDPSTGQPFPNNMIPATRINPVAKKIQDRFYPLPNFGDTSTLVSQNYREFKIRPRDPNSYWTARGDHRFSDKDSLFGRFTYQRALNRPYEGNLPTIGQRFQQRDNRAASIAYTHTFSPSLLNEFRWGFALNNNPIEGPINGNDLVSELGLTGLVPDLPDVSGIFKVNWTGLGLAPITQVDYTRPGFRNYLMEFQEHLSWFRGRHNFKGGFNLTRVEWDAGAANANLFGMHSYSNRYTGYPYADFLLGMPTTAARAFPFVVVNRLRWQYDLFFQDDIKVNQKLTVNLGFRYEYHPLWIEENGLSALFDIGSGKIVVPDGAMGQVSPLMPKGYVDVIEANAAGLPSETLIRSDKNNFLPRVGLAYRPFGERTVIRTGFGLFYDVVPRNITQGGIPFVINEPNFTNPTGTPAITLPQVFPTSGSGGLTTIGLPAAINTDLQIPYSMQWNLTLEHSRWDTGFRLSYIGTNTRKGDYSYNYNSPVPDARLFINKPRPFPQYPGINYFTNGAGHQFHGMTFEAERNMSNGLYYQFSWAYARDIGDLDRGVLSENPFDRQRERAVAMDIPTHRVTVNWLYQFPFGRGRKYLSGANRALNLLAGGWELSGIYSYYSGQFLTPYWTGPDPTGTAFTASSTPAEVTFRPDALRDGNLPKDQRSVNRWFDASAFAAPPLGRFGNSAKGVIIGPWVNVWHLGLFKDFRFGERAPLLRWELTATNAFNHPNWSNPGDAGLGMNNPGMNITQLAAVGVIRSVGGVNGASTGDQPYARSFRMGVRLEW